MVACRLLVILFISLLISGRQNLKRIFNCPAHFIINGKIEVMETIDTKRVYDHKNADGTFRILVDRLWPRGVKKTDFDFDEWNKDIAPSVALRKWFDHQPELFEEFSRLYNEELSVKEEMLQKIRKQAKSTPLSLMYGAKDPKINHAILLLNRLKSINIDLNP